MFNTPTKALVAGALMLLLLGGAALAMPVHAQDSDHAMDDHGGNGSHTDAAYANDSAHANESHANESSLSVHATTEGDELVIDVAYEGEAAATVDVEASDASYADAGDYRVTENRTFRLQQPEGNAVVEVTVEGNRSRVGLVWRPATWGDCFGARPYVLEPSSLEHREGGEWVSASDRAERFVRPRVDPCALLERVRGNHSFHAENGSLDVPDMDYSDSDPNVTTEEREPREIDPVDPTENATTEELPEIPEWERPRSVEPPAMPCFDDPETECIDRDIEIDVPDREEPDEDEWDDPR